MLVLVVWLSGFLVIGGLGLLFATGDGSSARATKRINALAAGAKAEKSKARNPAVEQAGRRKQIIQNLRTNERLERKARDTLEARLQQAGLTIDVRMFYIISVTFGLMAGAGAFVGMRNAIIGLFVVLVASLGLPRWLIGVLIKRRLTKFTEEFPNATDVIVRGIKSGLPVMDCLRIIGRESPEPLAAEFRRLVESLGLGMAIDTALEKMYNRMPTSEVRYFSIVLSIQQKTGGNLAEALGNLSAVLRARKLMREKIKAMSGEAVASAFIIGSLPPGIMILVSLTTKGYMDPLFHDPRGNAMLLFSAVWMGLGIFLMRKMINFKM